MKNLIIVKILTAALLFTGCANLQSLPQYLGTPNAVQADIVILGALAKGKIPADAQTKIHEFATYLNQAASLDLDALFKLLPGTTGSQNGDALISAAKAYLTSVVQRYGARNETTIAYGHAVANGLLTNF